MVCLMIKASGHVIIIPIICQQDEHPMTKPLTKLIKYSRYVDLNHSFAFVSHRACRCDPSNHAA